MAKVLSANHDILFMERLKVKKGYRFVSSHEEVTGLLRDGGFPGFSL